MGDYYDPKDLGRFAEMGEEAPDLWKKFADWYGAVFAEGALGERDKALIALGVAHAVQCPYTPPGSSTGTNAGGFTEHYVPITEKTRRTGIEVLEIVDRAVELGFLAPAPDEKACDFCDFLPVCGSAQENRVRRKAKDRLGDLIDLRSRV